MSVKVSVIVPAYNAQDTIAETIKAVLAQTYSGEIELIVVDDGSKDGTAEKIRSFPQVHYVCQDNAGPASARNAGAQAAAGEVLLFTDSDCRPEPQWVEKMLAGFSSDDIGVVAGSYDIANPASLLARCIHGEIVFRHKRLMPEFPKAFGGYNFAIRKELFDRIGGFNGAYRRASGEDNDLSYKVLSSGSRIRFLPEARVAHYHQTILGKYLKEQFRHGFWRVRMYLDHPQMAGGDDYTFWKDILEVPMAVLQLALVFWPASLAGVVATFFLFEISWGLIMVPSGLDGLAAGCVMWLRSFVRTAGFCWGGIYFLKYHLRTHKKI